MEATQGGRMVYGSSTRSLSVLHGEYCKNKNRTHSPHRRIIPRDISMPQTSFFDNVTNAARMLADILCNQALDLLFSTLSTDQMRALSQLDKLFKCIIHDPSLDALVKTTIALPPAPATLLRKPIGGEGVQLQLHHDHL